jgi:hypothetical protein
MIDWNAYLQWRTAFAAAVDDRLYPLEWVDARILAGSAQFWRSDAAAAVTEIRYYPTGAYDVHGLVAAGDAGEVRDRIIPQVEAWGRSIGALGIVIESRPGWARILRPAGFRAHQLAVRKELGGTRVDLSQAQ